MTETRTARMNQPQWSSGSDSPSRTDFNEAGLAVETRTAIDRLTPDSALPSSGIVNAEYFVRTATIGGTALRTLYRGDSGGTLRAHNWVPETLRVRPADTVASTAEGLRVDHPDVTLPALTTTWDGKVTARHSLVLGAASDTSLGRLSVGGLDAVPAGVRARITAAGAERALELRAGDGSVTELLRAVDSAGSAVLTISGAGGLTSTQAAAFGGTSPGAASLTGAPQPTGAQTAGLLAHGLESATSRAALQVNRYAPGSSDPAAILSVLPSTITVGRLGAWSGGQLDLGAPTLRVVTPRMAWFPSEASISGTSGFNPFPGLTGFAGFDSSVGLFTAVGTEFNNFGDPTKISCEVASYNSSAGTWAGDLLRMYQCELISGSPDAVVVGKMDAAGRLSTNAPWRGSGGKPTELRDARQNITHQCTKIWAAPGNLTAGLFIGSGGSVLYTWPTMTVRSSSITQLEIELRLELLCFRSGGATVGRQVIQIRWDYQISGGSWNSLSPNPQEGAPLNTSDFNTPGSLQDTWTGIVPITAAAGAPFRLRMTVDIGTGSDVRLRRGDFIAREAIIQSYNPSE